MKQVHLSYSFYRTSRRAFAGFTFFPSIESLRDPVCNDRAVGFTIVWGWRLLFVRFGPGRQERELRKVLNRTSHLLASLTTFNDGGPSPV